jgi:hypothetical protein
MDYLAGGQVGGRYVLLNIPEFNKWVADILTLSWGICSNFG